MSSTFIFTQLFICTKVALQYVQMGGQKSHSTPLPVLCSDVLQ